MKKIIICFISIFFLNGIYCENTKNKYSTELESVGANLMEHSINEHGPMR